MIYFIADLHAGESVDGINSCLASYKKGDLIIILGDIGTEFVNTEENREFTKWFLSLKADIAFLDGNHEKFEYFNSFPLEDWNGGKVHRLTPNIVHLMRGNVYEIFNKKFFVMGGCKSSQRWVDLGLVNPLEMPSEEEFSLAYGKLNKLNNKVDYILTHKYPKFPAGITEFDKNSIEGLSKYIDDKVEFKHWYSGHWHRTTFLDDKHTIVYDNPIILEI